MGYQYDEEIESLVGQREREVEKERVEETEGIREKGRRREGEKEGDRLR